LLNEKIAVSFIFVSVQGSFEINSKSSVATASAEKQRIAEEVASILKLSVEITASERLLLTLYLPGRLEEYYLIFIA
jgi:hypothetical protein